MIIIINNLREYYKVKNKNIFCSSLDISPWNTYRDRPHIMKFVISILIPIACTYVVIASGYVSFIFS